MSTTTVRGKHVNCKTGLSLTLPNLKVNTKSWRILKKDRHSIVCGRRPLLPVPQTTDDTYDNKQKCTMRRIEVVNVFVFTECYELSTRRLVLRDNTPIFTEHPDKQRPHLHFLFRFMSTLK